jgi:leader peptidase (prepilin peptidase)/N-methyltransferase
MTGRAVAATRTLPRLNWQGALALSAAVLLAPAAIHRGHNPLHAALLAAAAALLVLLAARDIESLRLPNRLMYPGLLAAFMLLPGFGAGDVKLCTLIGLLVGWPHVITALLLGVCCNGCVALAMLCAGRAGRRTAMPYGPGLIAGALDCAKRR